MDSRSIEGVIGFLFLAWASGRPVTRAFLQPRNPLEHPHCHDRETQCLGQANRKRAEKRFLVMAQTRWEQDP